MHFMDSTFEYFFLCSAHPHLDSNKQKLTQHLYKVTYPLISFFSLSYSMIHGIYIMNNIRKGGDRF